jgi:hypothetical protein
MVSSVLATDGFYFCTDYDLTHTLQRLANTSPDFQEMSLLERVRHRPSSRVELKPGLLTMISRYATDDRQ